MTNLLEIPRYSHHLKHAVVDGNRKCTGKPVPVAKVHESEYPPSCPKCAK